MRSGNLNFLEPSGQLQACNGTALPVINRQTARCKSVFFFSRSNVRIFPSPPRRLSSVKSKEAAAVYNVVYVHTVNFLGTTVEFLTTFLSLVFRLKV